ncbi:TPA: hypothetical protein G8R26_003591 [Salmonella enterica]|uniref:Fimbrial protein n=2 Tax=Salmonella enterica TaxID=28901 RepID=A0A742R5P8_SALER|nr:hypothetical protein [Salmonella enterica subsp. enterica serovar Koketime]EAM8931065.1 hypothetical protein [Salmonella enterica]EHG8445821.1 hypothetical protein [Salmonella enterica subsp. enterica]EBB4439041.1 hypothetical protein [Salmonella enterica]EBR9055848.1 hypothetical protein [Salmonella enterica subsp. enterica serovar Koketime]
MNKLQTLLLVASLSIGHYALADYTECNVLLTPTTQDYGRIHKDELNFTATDKGQAAALHKRQAQLTVTCPEEKEVFDLTFLGNMTPNNDLAFSETGKVILTLDNLTADTGSVFLKRTVGKELSTEPVSSLRIYMGDRIKLVDTAGLPLSLQSFRATVEIEPWVAESTYSDLANDKKLEGSLTVRIEPAE